MLINPRWRFAQQIGNIAGGYDRHGQHPPISLYINETEDEGKGGVLS